MTSERPLLTEEIAAYQRDGYLAISGLFSAAELAPIDEALRVDPTVAGRLYNVHDGEGVGGHDYLGWTRHGDDYLGAMTRIARLVEGAAALIGEPVYHFHSKLVCKPPHGGDIVDWHQDFGGWYQDGCLLPDMLTCIVAVTEATPENGCLTFLRGSHAMGRIDRVVSDHAYYTIQPQRLAAMRQRFQAVTIPMAPGDGLFFHGNAVHSSPVNRSGETRRLLEFSYNAVSNPPVFDGQDHHAVKPLEVVADDALRRGDFNAVFGDTPLHDIDDPANEGYTIFNRDHVPVHC
ncbi:MAG: phytanoyl-CoA dioxygenase family protein [Pseudomonadota bacterium]|nr:phytanoyl-CoA dioxygenase family protein [Pseudomonadota bacterium]